jgi:hypothetical protein
LLVEAKSDVNAKDNGYDLNLPLPLPLFALHARLKMAAQDLI